MPEQGFVFCCFDTSYKLTCGFFDVWMRLLNTVPGSGLWLVAANPLVKDSLRREAARRGVAAKRLVFSAPTSRPEYLARPRVADLLLDTLPYNAGATAFAVSLSANDSRTPSQNRCLPRPSGISQRRGLSIEYR